MKKLFSIFAACCITASVFAVNVVSGPPVTGPDKSFQTPSFKVDEKAMASRFSDLDKVEQYVSENKQTDLSKMMISDKKNLLVSSNFDVISANDHKNVHNAFPSFKEHPVWYIVSIVLVVLIVIFYIATGGQGYSSRNS